MLLHPFFYLKCQYTRERDFQESVCAFQGLNNKDFSRAKNLNYVVVVVVVMAAANIIT